MSPSTTTTRRVGEFFCHFSFFFIFFMLLLFSCFILVQFFYLYNFSGMHLVRWRMAKFLFLKNYSLHKSFFISYSKCKVHIASCSLSSVLYTWCGKGRAMFNEHNFRWQLIYYTFFSSFFSFCSSSTEQYSVVT